MAESQCLDPTLVPETWDVERPHAPDSPRSLTSASLSLAATIACTPSPADWRDETFYAVLIDRFARSEGAAGHGDPTLGWTWHGGNLRGISERMDYVRSGGYTALILSPVFHNAPGGYHGYWPVHMMSVEPRFGTMADLQHLVRTAHAAGVRVILDYVMNHAGKVFEYRGESQWGGSPRPREIEFLRDIFPAELADPARFYRRGVLVDWSDPEQSLRGDFPPHLRHYNHEDPETQDLLIKIAQWWIVETDIDGFRLDACRHMHPAFLRRFYDEVRAFAKAVGKDNFLLIGEIADGSDARVAETVGIGKLHGAYNYPAYRRDNAALHGQAPAAALAHSLRMNQHHFGESLMWMLRFIDGHDVYRFLRSSTPRALLDVAAAYQFTAQGIPVVYYGTEQQFRQNVETMAPEGPHLRADPRNREDMFAAGRFVSASSRGDKFDPGAPSYRFIARLAALRAKLPALRRGSQVVRWAEPDGPGLLIFSRVYEREEVLVAINTSSIARTAAVDVDGWHLPPGTAMRDHLSADYIAVTYRSRHGGARLRVGLPSYGVRVLVRER